MPETIESLRRANTRLREEVELLQEEKRQRDQKLKIAGADLPAEWRLSQTERSVLMELYNRPDHQASKWQMAVAMQKADRTSSYIDVYICKVRAKLKPHGITITTIWGIGYSLPPESVKIIKEAIEGQKK